MSNAVQDAANTLRQALSEKGITVTDQAIPWMLGQVMGESNFGTAPDWTIPNDLNDANNNPDAPIGPSYNWGAVRAGNTQPFIWHYDQDANGVMGTYKFARYTSHLDSAKHYLGALLRSDLNTAVADVLADPNAVPFDLARAMYTRNVDPNVLTRSNQAYYTGTAGSDQARIQAYANLISAGAKKAIAALGGANGPDPLVQASLAARLKALQQKPAVQEAEGIARPLILAGALVAAGYGAYKVAPHVGEWVKGKFHKKETA